MPRRSNGKGSVKPNINRAKYPRRSRTPGPSLAHRVGFQEWWGRAARRGASPATAIAFNIVLFSADLRSCLTAIACPTLVIARTDGYANMSAHGRYLAELSRALRRIEAEGGDEQTW